jgi:hypothetical protein
MRRRAGAHPVDSIVATLFSLWDFYIGPYSGGIRPFDLIGGAILGGDRVVRGGDIRLSEWQRIGVSTVIAVMVWAFVNSALQDPSTNWKPVSGVALGLVIMLLTLARPPGPRAVEQLTRVLILVHGAALLLQFTWYHTTGLILNYHAITGGSPRLVGAFFRPAGLFLEPSLFCVLTTMLVLLRLRLLRRLDRVCLIGLAGMLLSLSLLGVAAVIWILIRSRPVLGSLLASAVAAAGAAAASVLPKESAIYALVLARVTNLSSDSSALERFGGLLGAGDASSPPITALLFGRGVGYSYVALGSSGVSFLLAAVGVVGMVCFLLGLGFAARRRNRIGTVVDVIFLMLGAPFWTFFAWWWWLAALMTARAVPYPRQPRSAAIRLAPVSPEPAHAAPR